MTDLEMMRLAAEAMGLKVRVVGDGPTAMLISQRGAYDPLRVDSQAMALVKKFRLRVDGCFEVSDKDWRIDLFSDDGNTILGYGQSPDLNRAIVECVAKMQAEKSK